MTGAATRQIAVLAGLKDGDCLTVEDLSNLTGLERRAVVQGAGNLLTRRLIERTERGCYRITETGRTNLRDGTPLTSGPNRPLTQRRPPKRRTFRQKVWAALRIKSKATVADILTVAEGGTADNVRRYFLLLEEFGYVKRMARLVKGDALTSPGAVRWMLLKNTGPKAPVSRFDKTKLYDPNLDILVDLPGAPGVDAEAENVHG